MAHGVGLGASLSTWLESWGPFGLFLAAALDSFVPLAQVVDPMVVVLSYRTRNPVLYAGLATLGSVAGTSVLYALVRAGGEAFVARRVKPERRAHLEGVVRRNGVLAVFAGGLLPPPFPFKAVVLLSGMLRMPYWLFVAGLVAARSVRYGLEATLAVYWGDAVLGFMKDRYPYIGLGLVVVTVAAIAASRHWMRRGEGRAPEGE